MLSQLLRSAAAILAGFIPALVFAIGVEGVSSVLYPFPPGADPADLDVCRAHVAALPAGAFVQGALGWSLGTFFSSWLATRIGPGRHVAHGLFVGLVLLIAAVANMLMLPYPWGFWVANLIGLPAGAFLGCRLATTRNRTPGAPLPGDQ